MKLRTLASIAVAFGAFGLIFLGPVVAASGSTPHPAPDCYCSPSPRPTPTCRPSRSPSPRPSHSRKPSPHPSVSHSPSAHPSPSAPASKSPTHAPSPSRSHPHATASGSGGGTLPLTGSPVYALSAAGALGLVGGGSLVVCSRMRRRES